MKMVHRKDEMYRVVLWIKPKKGLANNGSVNPMKHMKVKKVFRFHEHKTPSFLFLFPLPLLLRQYEEDMMTTFRLALN